jgi:flagellar biosynthesis protein FlhF
MKMFIAETIGAAMELIRSEMGEDAIILTQRETENGVEVRAAVERPMNRRAPEPIFRHEAPSPVATGRARERLKDLLCWHGAPEGFADVAANAGLALAGPQDDPVPGLAAAFETVLGFSPIPPLPDRAIVLIGAPGVGKTASAAKLIARAEANDVDVELIAADLDGTGGRERLAAFLERAPDKIATVYSPDDAIRAAKAMHEARRTFIMDAPPINPFDPDDVDLMSQLIAALNAEPVAVLSAEGHPSDLEDMARIYARMGVRRAIVTKLDVARRRAGVVAALASARLALAQFALTAFIPGGLIPATPSRLARLIVETAPEPAALKGAA